jgi:hypothetical protein
MAQVEMRALRRFTIMRGESVQPIAQGETFTATEREASLLAAAGKAEPIEQTPAKPAKKGI